MANKCEDYSPSEYYDGEGGFTTAGEPKKMIYDLMYELDSRATVCPTNPDQPCDACLDKAYENAYNRTTGRS